MELQNKKPLPFLAVRGSNGISLVNWSGEKTETCENTIISKNVCRVMKFSKSGEKLAWCDGLKLQVMNVTSKEIIFTTQLARTYAMCFSADETILSTWEPYAVTKEFPQGKPNLQMWDIKSGDCVHELVQKKVDGWQPSWGSKSGICAKLMGSTVQFYQNNNFRQSVAKLNIPKLESFEISPNEDRLRIACFVRGSKGAPSSVRIFNYPRFSPADVIASKSFFKADSVKILWNKQGTSVLVKAAVDVDTTGESYYGEQSLHFMSCKGETAIVSLSKKGPIYDAAWSPNSMHFCVVFGFMPAKACIFDLKCNQVFEFGPTPKNECYFNPQGNLLALAGFGNLRGNVEIWDYERKKQVGQFQSLDTTFFEWCSDGANFVTATTSPRLRVGNGYRFWNFKAGICYEHKAEGDINEVLWQPALEGIFPAPLVQNVSNKEIKDIIKASKPASYVPPHARGKQTYSEAKNRFERDDEEHVPSDKPLSKSAQKNRKKRDQKRGKQVTEPTFTNMSSEQKDALDMAKYLLNDSSLPQNSEANSTEKRIKGLRKKLQAIEKLKKQQQEGKQLEKNQITKLNTEASLIQELEQLEINS